MKTPFYRYYPDILEENILKFQQLQKLGVKIYYAIKANNYIPLVSRIIESGFGFDIASKEELKLIEKLGCNINEVSFSAPSKLHADIRYATKKGVKYYAFDSIEEVKKIVRINPKAILLARISIQNDDASFNLSDKFGVDEESLHSMIENNFDIFRNNLKGITFHVGSQNTKLNQWKVAYEKCIKIAKYWIGKGIMIDIINIGGGMPTQYSPNDPDLDQSLSELSNLALRIKKDSIFKTIIVEPGRSMSANTMDLYTKIINIKEHKNPTLLDLDISIFNGLIEPLEHFEYKITSEKTSEQQRVYRVGGYSCDGYDIIRKEALLPSNLEVGDILKIEKAGAYTFVYNNFHLKRFPQIS